MLAEQDLLRNTGHRPYHLPDTPYVGYQQWHNVVFLHFRVPPAVVTSLLPPGLIADEFDGDAWVSLVAFTIRKMAPRYFINHPVFPDLEQINIRTYVKTDHCNGIYMFDIAANNRLFSWLAASLFHAPYHIAVISAAERHYQCLDAPFHLDINYSAGEDIHSKSQLDIWLTERYTLFTNTYSKIYRQDIHHLE